jgi:crotonobetainyl-CoA:carnitine CoA-transferase CaiB-like acyl-CoA transferase
LRKIFIYSNKPGFKTMESKTSEYNKGVLKGIKVVDLTRFIAGPVCTQILADMGAETIKIESKAGDSSRYNTPLMGDVGGYFPGFNRNKKSVTLNLKDEKGKQLLRRFIEWGDVLVENFSAGTMEKLGFPYPIVKEINPGMIMVSITGFGQTGPLAHRPAFDIVGQALSGMMGITGFKDRPPVYTASPIADYIAGYFSTIGTLLALYHRKATGEGQYVDASLAEGLLVTMTSIILQQARGITRKRGIHHIGPIGTFQTADGAYVLIMAQDDRHWPRMAGVLGNPELASDPRYRSRAARSRHVDELNSLVEQWVRARPVAEVDRVLDAEGIPFSVVKTVEEVLEDPHYRFREMLVDVEHYDNEVIPLVAPYPKLSLTPGTIRTVCPRLGEHNEIVYGDILGISKEELLKLEKEGVV